MHKCVKYDFPIFHKGNSQKVEITKFLYAVSLGGLRPQPPVPAAPVLDVMNCET